MCRSRMPTQCRGTQTPRLQVSENQSFYRYILWNSDPICFTKTLGKHQPFYNETAKGGNFEKNFSNCLSYIH